MAGLVRPSTFLMLYFEDMDAARSAGMAINHTQVLLLTGAAAVPDCHEKYPGGAPGRPRPFADAAAAGPSGTASRNQTKFCRRHRSQPQTIPSPRRAGCNPPQPFAACRAAAPARDR